MAKRTLIYSTADKNDDNHETRIGRRIQPQPNGCWIYGDDPDKYGSDRKLVVRVHRFVYETLVGPIPKGHHLHHKCQTPACCNPAHLEPLSPDEHAKAHKDLRAA